MVVWVSLKEKELLMIEMEQREEERKNGEERIRKARREERRKERTEEKLFFDFWKRINLAFAHILVRRASALVVRGDSLHL